jgi:hypothetical protein
MPESISSWAWQGLPYPVSLVCLVYLVDELESQDWLVLQIEYI